jgi:ABC-type protease/lipase transport system fused ATPase/permease subunit
VINESDLLLILTEGTTRAYGPRADVLKALEEANRKASAPAVAAPAAPQAGEAS